MSEEDIKDIEKGISDISLDEKNRIHYIVKIQSIVRGNYTRKYIHLLYLLNLLNRNNDIMIQCFEEINKILYLFPPKKNLNKFIYGKVAELSIINYINKIYNCDELDKKLDNGSEYINDCIINKNKYSIKISKSGGNITIINKNTRDIHDIKNINFIVCHIEKKKLYIFNSDMIPEKYKKDTNSNISYKSTIFKYLDKNFNNFVYTFKNNILKIYDEMYIYDYIYNTFIKK
jgi:hypothetical protein